MSHKPSRSEVGDVGRTRRKGAMCGTPDGRTGLYCPVCGESFPFPIGVMPWVTGVVVAFNKAHSACLPTDKNIRTGLMALPGVCAGVPLERGKGNGAA